MSGIILRLARSARQPVNVLRSSNTGVVVKSFLKCGVCVSCGRESRNMSCICPYCGETVWRPFWLKAVRAATLVVPLVLCLWIAGSGGYGAHAWIRALAEMPRWARFLYACGVTALLFPVSDVAQVLDSTRSLWRFQAVSTANNLLVCLPMMWASVFMKEISMTPFDARRALAAALICCCGVFLWEGSEIRLMLNVAVFLAAGLIRILL